MSSTSHAIYLMFLLTQSALSMQAAEERRFFKATNSSLGAIRLSKPWITSSLLSCAYQCKTRYPTSCFGFMYNHVIRQCLPTGWPDSHEARPSSDEGQLYTSVSCDTSSGFSFYSYGTAVGCLLFPNIGKLPYSSAYSTCQYLSSRLITIKTADKAHLPIRFTTNNIYIGLNDLVREGTFLWDDDDSEITTAWKSQLFFPGEPNNASNEDCVQYDPNALLPGANDVHCSKIALDFICERPTS